MNSAFKCLYSIHIFRNIIFQYFDLFFFSLLWLIIKMNLVRKWKAMRNNKEIDEYFNKSHNNFNIWFLCCYVYFSLNVELLRQPIDDSTRLLFSHNFKNNDFHQKKIFIIHNWRFTIECMKHLGNYEFMKSSYKWFVQKHLFFFIFLLRTIISSELITDTFVLRAEIKLD